MQVRWYLYRFDHARYLRIRPLLRAASTPEAFAVLAAGPEGDAITDAVADEEMSLPEARSALVHAVCCVGEPVPFDSKLVRLVVALERLPEMEATAKLLSRMLSGGKSLEPWLLPSTGLTGFLTPQETSTLSLAYAVLSPRALRKAHMPGVPARRGGVLRACIGLMRHLRDSGPQTEEMLRLLGRLLDEAACNGEGIAAVTA